MYELHNEDSQLFGYYLHEEYNYIVQHEGEKVYITELLSLYVAGFDERIASRGYQYQCYKIVTTGYAMLKLVVFFFLFFPLPGFFFLPNFSRKRCILKARAESAKRALDHIWAPGAHRHGEQVIFSVVEARL